MGDRVADYVISSTAQGNPYRSSDFAVSLILMVFLFAFIFAVLPMFGSLKSIRNSITTKLSEFDESGKKIHRIEAAENESPASDIEMFKQLKDKLKEANRMKGVLILSTIFTALFLLYLNFSAVVSSVANGNNTRFKNTVTVLSVYLSDLEIKQLKANWVRMKTKKDYQEIKNQIDAYCKKFDVKE